MSFLNHRKILVDKIIMETDLNFLDVYIRIYGLAFKGECNAGKL